MKRLIKIVKPIFIFVGVCLAILILGATCCKLYYRKVLQDNFVYNGRNDPYARGIPLHEMDFSVYDEYFKVDASIGILYTGDRTVVLPCDVTYYTNKEDAEPAIILKKGTRVYYALEGEAGPPRGFGVCCWPDYEKEWRYGVPFSTEDFAEPLSKENPMYYVKTKQLLAVAEEYCETHPYAKARVLANTVGMYKVHVTQALDRKLYSKGVFCSEDYMENSLWWYIGHNSREFIVSMNRYLKQL